jgi:hypothetical protein
MSKKIAILQSNYIPWKGYFDLINMVDEFVIYDDVQYTRRDWRNRNLIKTPQGLLWLTIPVEVKGKYYQTIKDTVISEKKWPKKHWTAISINYLKSKYYREYKEFFEKLYLDCNEKYLSEINYKFIKAINKLLGIKTNISRSSDYSLTNGKTERLVDICIQSKATEYISGPAAKDYIDEKLFLENGINLTWMDYSNYPIYNQLYPPFEHGVSIVDLIFNEGINAHRFMKSFNRVTK